MERRPSKLQILIVEDKVADIQFIQNLLHSGDAYECTPVSSLTEALEQLEKQTFDVALVDLHLGDSYGPATVSAISRMAPDLPIVVVTGDINPEAEIMSATAGAVGFLVKTDLVYETLQTELQVAITRHSRSVLNRRLALKKESLTTSDSLAVEEMQNLLKQIQNLQGGMTREIVESLTYEFAKIPTVVQKQMHPLAGDVAEIKATLRVIQSTVDGHSRLLTGGSAPEKGLLHRTAAMQESVKRLRESISSKEKDKTNQELTLGLEKTKGRTAIQLALIGIFGTAISALTSAYVATHVKQDQLEKLQKSLPGIIAPAQGSTE